MTPYHVISIVDWHKNTSVTHTIQIINFEATTTQASSLFLAENVSLYQKKKKTKPKKVPSWLNLRTLSSVAHHV